MSRCIINKQLIKIVTYMEQIKTNDKIWPAAINKLPQTPLPPPHSSPDFPQLPSLHLRRPLGIVRPLSTQDIRWWRCPHLVEVQLLVEIARRLRPVRLPILLWVALATRSTSPDTGPSRVSLCARGCPVTCRGCYGLYYIFSPPWYAV